MSITSRRSFIRGAVSLIAAPAIVRSSSLMPVKQMSDRIIYPTIIDPTGRDFARFQIVTLEQIAAQMGVPYGKLLSSMEVEARMVERLGLIAPPFRRDIA